MGSRYRYRFGLLDTLHLRLQKLQSTVWYSSTKTTSTSFSFLYARSSNLFLILFSGARRSPCIHFEIFVSPNSAKVVASFLTTAFVDPQACSKTSLVVSWWLDWCLWLPEHHPRLLGGLGLVFPCQSSSYSHWGVSLPTFSSKTARTRTSHRPRPSSFSSPETSRPSATCRRCRFFPVAEHVVPRRLGISHVRRDVIELGAVSSCMPMQPARPGLSVLDSSVVFFVGILPLFDRDKSNFFLAGVCFILVYRRRYFLLCFLHIRHRHNVFFLHRFLNHRRNRNSLLIILLLRLVYNTYNARSFLLLRLLHGCYNSSRSLLGFLCC